MFISALLAAAVLPAAVHAFSSYDNEFVDPNYIISKNFPNTTIIAQQEIVSWADYLTAQGPWSVMNKSVVPPTGDKHTYMSWAPYSWPNCTGVGNTTELTPEQIWVTCPYYTRDGVFNPDRLLVNDTGGMSAMADGVFYNAMAWIINGSSSYENNAVNLLYTWFLNPDTYMLPNLDYAQMARGPDGQNGSHTGVLDLKCMTKVVSGILILRGAKSTAWTSDYDTQLTNWTNTYINWLQTSPLALAEKAAVNNHGSFYYNQLSSLHILVGDTAGAKQILQEYFQGIYLNQIDANGEQPFEAVRTRPYHYRSYNLAAMIVNSRLAEYVGYDTWNLTTTNGGTIKAACDFAMTVPPGDELASELYIDVAAVGAIYGDNGTYSSFLKNGEVDYPSEPYFLWDQPLTDSGWVANNLNFTSDGNTTGTSTGSSSSSSAAAMDRKIGGLYSLVAIIFLTGLSIELGGSLDSILSSLL